MNERKAVIALLIAAVIAVVGSIILNTFTVNAWQPFNNGKMRGWFSFTKWVNNQIATDKSVMGSKELMRGKGWFRCGFIEVSQEYKNNVINIIQSDSDVQKLLEDGYNVVDVKPVIKAIVEGDGSVIMKATSAIVMLEKDTVGRAIVWVDLEQGKVTKIAVTSIIEKS